MVIAVRSVQNGNGKGLREASRFYNIPAETLDSTGTPGRWGIRTICRYSIPAIVTGSVEVGCRAGVDPLSQGEISVAYTLSAVSCQLSAVSSCKRQL